LFFLKSLYETSELPKALIFAERVVGISSRVLIQHELRSVIVLLNVIGCGLLVIATLAELEISSDSSRDPNKCTQRRRADG
jgi:hypothetical protein